MHSDRWKPRMPKMSSRAEYDSYSAGLRKHVAPVLAEKQRRSRLDTILMIVTIVCLGATAGMLRWLW